MQLPSYKTNDGSFTNVKLAPDSPASYSRIWGWRIWCQLHVGESFCTEWHRYVCSDNGEVDCRTEAITNDESNERDKNHDDVIKWKHFPRYWPFVRGIHRSPVNSPLKGQWRGALMFSSICAWINGWVKNREAGDLRCHRAHYDVTVMMFLHTNNAAHPSPPPPHNTEAYPSSLPYPQCHGFINKQEISLPVYRGLWLRQPPVTLVTTKWTHMRLTTCNDASDDKKMFKISILLPNLVAFSCYTVNIHFEKCLIFFEVRYQACDLMRFIQQTHINISHQTCEYHLSHAAG